MMIAQDKMNNTNKTGSLIVVLELATEEIHIIAKKSSGLANFRISTKRNWASETKNRDPLPPPS